VLKAPRTKRLRLKYDKLLSILRQFCVLFQLAPLHLGLVDGYGNSTGGRRGQTVLVQGVVAGASERIPVVTLCYRIKGKTMTVQARPATVSLFFCIVLALYHKVECECECECPCVSVGPHSAMQRGVCLRNHTLCPRLPGTSDCFR